MKKQFHVPQSGAGRAHPASCRPTKAKPGAVPSPLLHQPVRRTAAFPLQVKSPDSGWCSLLAGLPRSHKGVQSGSFSSLGLSWDSVNISITCSSITAQEGGSAGTLQRSTHSPVRMWRPLLVEQVQVHSDDVPGGASCSVHSSSGETEKAEVAAVSSWLFQWHLLWEVIVLLMTALPLCTLHLPCAYHSTRTRPFFSPHL